jgi:dnd system-associated protein 4
VDQGVGMADARVKIAKDKAELVKALNDGSDMNGPFQTYADVIAFAAALGAKQGKRVPVTEVLSNPDPIPQEHFISSKYETLINLIAVTETKEPKTLADNEATEEHRIRVFEENANADLEIIENSLNGTIDYLEQILLMMSNKKL